MSRARSTTKAPGSTDRVPLPQDLGRCRIGRLLDLRIASRWSAQGAKGQGGLYFNAGEDVQSSEGTISAGEGVSSRIVASAKTGETLNIARPCVLSLLVACTTSPPEVTDAKCYDARTAPVLVMDPVLAVPQGEVGLVFASIGKTLNVIDAAMFSAVVLMVVVTTLATPPLLKLTLGQGTEDEETEEELTKRCQ